jgi:hypothetical protein
MMQLFSVRCSASSGNLDFQTNLPRERRMRMRSRLGTNHAVTPLSEAYNRSHACFFLSDSLFDRFVAFSGTDGEKSARSVTNSLANEYKSTSERAMSKEMTKYHCFTTVF